MPVETIGISGRTSGTACAIMFEPIKARLASSCSRKGIKRCADTNYLVWSNIHIIQVLRCSENKTGMMPAGDTHAFANSLRNSCTAFAWAITYLSSASAERYSYSSETYGMIAMSRLVLAIILSILFGDAFAGFDQHFPALGIGQRSSRKAWPSNVGSSQAICLMTRR